MSFLTFALLYIAYPMTDTLLKYNLGNDVTAFLPHAFRLYHFRQKK